MTREPLALTTINMSDSFTAAELEAYLDEELAPEEMAAVEERLQDQGDLVQELVAINTRREAGASAAARD